MFTIIGIVVVFGAVVAGYLMEHGNLKVLIQPAELVIIGGAAIGTVLIANPLHILKKIAGGTGSGVWRNEVQQAALPGNSEDDVRTFQPRAKRWTDGAGNGQRCAGSEPDLVEVPVIFERPPCVAFCVRFDSAGIERRCGSV